MDPEQDTLDAHYPAIEEEYPHAVRCLVLQLFLSQITALCLRLNDVCWHKHLCL